MKKSIKDIVKEIRFKTGKIAMVLRSLVGGRDINGFGDKRPGLPLGNTDSTILSLRTLLDEYDFLILEETSLIEEEKKNVRT
jgi:hypothetical protein